LLLAQLCRARRLLTILQHTGKLPTMNNYLAQNTDNAEVEKLNLDLGREKFL
jgi:hypothetical protein